MKRIKGKITTLLMSLVLVLSLVAPVLPAIEVQAGTDTYTSLIPTDYDDATALAAKVVRFNGYDWYIIEDNSTAADAGSVTLLAKDPIATSKFDESSHDNTYSSSVVKALLDSMTAGGGDFADVADAIKSVDLTIYKYAGTDIHVSFEEVKAVPSRFIKVTVRDFGPGVSNEELPLIVEKYYRGKREKNKPGYGLGMYLVNRYMELQHGGLQYHNDGGFVVELFVAKV